MCFHRRRLLLVLVACVMTSACTTVRSSGKCAGKATRCRTACLNAAVIAVPPLSVRDLRPGTRGLVLRVTDGVRAGRFALGKLWLARARDDDKGNDGKAVDGAEDKRRGVALYGALDLDFAAIGLDFGDEKGAIVPTSRDPARPGVLVLRREPATSGKARSDSGAIYLQVGHPQNSRAAGESILDGEGLLLSVKRAGPFAFSGVWKGLGASGVFCAGAAR